MINLNNTFSWCSNFSLQKALQEQMYIVNCFGKRVSELTKYLPKIIDTLLLMSLITPVIDLVVEVLTDRKIIKINHIEEIPHNNLSPLAKKRLLEMKSHIHALAVQCGIVRPENIEVGVSHDCIDFMVVGSVNHGKIYVSPRNLFLEEDLPEELQLEKIDRKAISKDEWLEKCQVWLSREFSWDLSKAKTAFSKDYYKECLRSQLLLLRVPEVRKQVYEGAIAHEFGHLVYRHNLKTAFFSLAWQLFCIPTLFIPMFFRQQFLDWLSRTYEKEADLFSASKISHDGLRTLFEIYSNMNKRVHVLHPNKWNAEGLSSGSNTHPSVTERLNYIREFRSANATS